MFKVLLSFILSLFCIFVVLKFNSDLNVFFVMLGFLIFNFFLFEILKTIQNRFVFGEELNRKIEMLKKTADRIEGFNVFHLTFKNFNLSKTCSSTYVVLYNEKIDSFIEKFKFNYLFEQN